MNTSQKPFRDQILCAIKGKHHPVCPCEDSQKAAYLEDLWREGSSGPPYDAATATGMYDRD